MARQGNTTALGMGYAYQQDRKRAIAVMPDGAPCQMCGKPMYRTQKLHYDHVIPRVLGGVNGPRRIVHASCNLRAGQRLGAQLRRQRRGKVPAGRYNRW